MPRPHPRPVTSISGDGGPGTGGFQKLPWWWWCAGRAESHLFKWIDFLRKGLLTEIWEELRKQKWEVEALRDQQQREGINLPGLWEQREQTVSLQQQSKGHPVELRSAGTGLLPEKKAEGAGRKFPIPSLLLPPGSASSHWLTPNLGWLAREPGWCSPPQRSPFLESRQERKDGRMNSGRREGCGGSNEE